MLGLFEKQIARRPNKYSWTVPFVRAMREGFWTPEEFSFKSDYHDFKTKLSEHEKQIVVRNLTAIGQVEIAVKSFWGDLGKNLPHPYISDLGYTMANIEVIHNDAYEKLIVDILGLEKAFEENLKNPILLGRVNYLQKYLEQNYKDKRKQYIYALILFTLFVENVSLFSQFYIILWLNGRKKVLKDTAQQIQYTRNEELIHSQVGIKIVNTLREEYPELFDDELRNKIYDECYQAFIAESALIDWILQGYSEDGLTSEILKDFIKNRINQSLKEIGFDSVFEINQDSLKKSFWFDEELLGNNMTDFFHKRPVEYSKHNRAFDEEELF